MGKKKLCCIVSYGYDPPYPKFNSIGEAQQELKVMKQEDLSICRKRYGRAKVVPLGRGGYIIEFGDNVFSSAYIREL